jgi:hypothetical protein
MSVSKSSSVAIDNICGSDLEEAEGGRRVVATAFISAGKMGITDILALTTLIFTSALARKYT